MNSSCLISLGDRGASPSPCNTLDPATAVGIGSIPCTAGIAAVASYVEREDTCEEARLSLCCSLLLVEGCISGKGSNVVPIAATDTSTPAATAYGQTKL
jgi:hypothetical protein